MVYLDHIVHTYLFKHYPATGMQIGDEAVGRILVNQTIYVKLKNMQIKIVNINTILKTWYRNFARPKGVYYIHYASPSVRPIYFLHKSFLLAPDTDSPTFTMDRAHYSQSICIVRL